jgi:hypothetical protein
MITYNYREGTTEPITMTLYDGATAADISGYSSVSLFLRSTDNSVQSEATTANGGITVTTAASGVIALNPSLLTTALLYSKQGYYGYVIVVDGTGKRSSFPSNEDFVFRMLERYSGDG